MTKQYRRSAIIVGWVALLVVISAMVLGIDKVLDWLW